MPAAFDEARRVAHLFKTALDHLNLASYPKTSGGTGLHIYVPLDGSTSFEDVRRFAQAICRMVHDADAEATTFEWEIDKRAGKVFLDANMNRSLASAAAPYSLRSRWDAPVAMPCSWDELDEISPSDFTIATGVHRIVETGDVFEDVVADGQDLRPALRDLGLRESR